MKIDKETNILLAFGTLFMLVFVVFIGLPMNVSADPTTIYVDDVPGSGEGNPDEDYTSIQAAINAASAGDTIFIYSGTYIEQVSITKTLTLEGESKDTTIVKSPAGWYTIGFHINSVSGITLGNLKIQGFYYGIYVRYSSYSTINNNICTGNNYGINILGSPSSTINDNAVLGPGDVGIRLSGSTSCTLKNNHMADNDWNFNVDGYSKLDYDHDIDTTNTVDGKPIYYLKGISDVEFNSENSYKDAGFIGIIDSDNVIIKDLTFSNNYHGILLIDTTNSVIENVKVSDTYYGIYLYSSPSAEFTENTVSNNYYGIYLKESVSSTFTGNTASDNEYGIYLYFSGSSKMTNNTVAGNGQGIYLFHSDSSTLTNNIASGNIKGFQLNLSPLCIVTGNTAKDNTGSGIIVLDISDYTEVANNMVTGNGNGIQVQFISDVTVTDNIITGSSMYGIYMYYAQSCTFTGNTVTDNYQGIILTYSTSCILQNNTIENSEYNFGINGYVVSEYIHSIDSTNTINGKPIYYLNGVSNVVISPESKYKDPGYVALVNSDQIIIRDISMSGNIQGILLVQTSNSVIQGVEVYDNQKGIYLNSCESNTVTENTVMNNDWYGIHMDTSSSNFVTDNTIADNTQVGIYIRSGGSNQISGNTIANSVNGIYIYISNSNKVTMNTINGTNTGYGLYIVYADSGIVKSNTISWNRYGIFMMRSSSNSITCNKIAYNLYGLYVYYMSNGNSIFHNNVLDNTYQIYSYYATNAWDNGYPSGGNYFSDYTGSDANSDGIGDSPYIVDISTNDNYPLMNQWGANDSIGELFHDIESMELHADLEQSLEIKLNNTLDSIAKEKFNAAPNQLNAFINQVEAQRGKKLSEEQADQLIESAKIIIYMISTWI